MSSGGNELSNLERSARPEPSPGGVGLSAGTMLWAAAAGLATIALRWPFRTRLPLSWDSVQYVLGILRYDISLHQPHPPGYSLYVHSAKLLHLLGLPPYVALVALSLLAGGLTVALLTWWGGALAGKRGMAVAALLTIFSPLAWVYATHGDTYAVSGFFAVLVGYLCWRMLTDERAAAWPAALALGIAGGFRPTDMLFLFPLWLWSVRRRHWTRIVLGLVAVGVVTVAWALPMVLSSGGLANYRAASGQLSRMVMGLSLLGGNVAGFRVCLSYFLGSTAGLMLAAWPLAFFASRRHLARIMNDPRAWLFLAIWSVPAVLFYLLVHLGQAGYLMLLLGPAVLLVAAGVLRLAESLSAAQLGILLALIVLLNLVFTWSTLLANDRALEVSYARVSRWLADCNGADTVALTSVPRMGQVRSEHRMLTLRPAMYLLPHLPVYEFPLEVSLRGGGSPTYGYQMTSARAEPPVTLRGVRNLVLLDPELRDRLPVGTRVEQLYADARVEVYLVSLDPGAPLTLGQEGHLILTPAPLSEN